MDPLFLAKLYFLKSLASEVELFLRDFQRDDPAVPFLFSALTSTITNIMERFMTKDATESLTTLERSDIRNQKNHLKLQDLSLGFGTLRQLRKCDLTTEALEKFQTSCKNAMIAYISKLLKRSPLTEPLTCAASCLDRFLIHNAVYKVLICCG
ncbi:hypothetical protein QAD02_003436 [Eretmocerus hayati]|uniref:Uncharacterized protein n=1 Tax=Eretmocerus hayati TaxID=131215 RepID=A0ACC2NPL0_9HYME|nr:hypothetical protein QAD02_003436 [Eretmocerus hayati]